VFTTRFKKSLGANALGQLITISTQFIQIPLFLSFWPKEKYGEWMVLASVPALINFADGGFGMVAANAAAMYAGEEKWEDARRVIGRNLSFQMLLVTTLFIIIPLGLMFTGVIDSFKLNSVSHTNAFISVVLLAYSVLVTIPLSLVLGVYRAEGKDARCAMGVNLMRLLSMVGICLGLISGYEFVGLSLIIFLVNTLGLIILFFDSYKQCRVKLIPLRIEWSEVRHTFIPAFAHQLIPLGNGFYFQGQTFVVNLIVGPVGVVIFNTIRLASRIIAQIANSIKNSAWPEMSLMIGRAKPNELLKFVMRMSRLSLKVCIPVSIVILLLGPWAIKLWTHGQVVTDRRLLAVMLVASLISSSSAVATGFLQSINRHVVYAISYCLVAILTLAIACIFHDSGVWAIAYSMVASELIILLIVVYQVRKQMIYI